MKSVCIDGRMLRFSGIGTYLQGLLGGFSSIGAADLTFSVLGKSEDQSLTHFPLIELETPIYSLREQWTVPSAFRTTGAALFHAPHYNLPVRVASQCVVTIHDIIHLKFPEFLKSPFARAYANFFFKQAVPRCREIITLSEFTKQDLVQHLNYPADRITVCGGSWPRGVECVTSNDYAPSLKRWGIPAGYLLYVGNLKEFKNTPRLLRTYARLRQQDGSVPDLVLVGRNFIPGLEKEIQTTSHVRWLGSLETKELSHVYSAAGAFIFPSLYEGFGLPPLEAMACGIPVAASNRASLPEVLGNAALFFDPEDEDAMLQAMQRILQDTALREALKKKAVVQLQRHSWEKTAQNTLAVYRRHL